MFELGLHIIKTNILKRFQDAQVENVAIYSVNKISFQFDLVTFFNLIWPSFEFVQDLMEMNVLINFHEDRMQNVACRVLTRANVNDARWTDAGQNVITIAYLALCAQVS